MADSPIVIVLMGVAGSGKTTIGKELAAELGWAFHDADADHSPENIEHMRSGRPLSETQRRPWLDLLARRVKDWLAEERKTVLACSALTVDFRQQLAGGDKRVVFVHLSGPYALLNERVRNRESFMPASLLASQFEMLETPDDAIAVDASLPPAEITKRVREALQL